MLADVIDSDTYYTLFDVSFSMKSTSNYQQAIDDFGEVLYEENGIKVVSQTITDDMYGISIRLFVSNNSGYNIQTHADHVSVNGFTISCWMYDVIPDGTVRYCDMRFFDSDLEENEIKDIQEVSFTFSAMDQDSFNMVAESDELKIIVE